ncbi:MAG: type VI secretion system tube protein Hcp [Planctomycetia bacterium]|nr:type VI secretion system tube protein Hcp [Planctomycetia bacterium]
MPIYVQYNAGAIKGNVTEKGHKDWVEVNSFQWGVGRGIGSPVGKSANRESSAPSISEIVVSKEMDKSSFSWLQEALKGKGVLCTIHFCSTDAGQLRMYAEYKLENCMISGYSVSSGGDRPSESISINFTKIEYVFNEYGADNSVTSSPRVSYDLSEAVTA